MPVAPNGNNSSLVDQDRDDIGAILSFPQIEVRMTFVDFVISNVANRGNTLDLLLDSF